MPIAQRVSCFVVVLVLSGCPGPSGTDAGTDAGLSPQSFIIHYHRPLSDYSGWTVSTSAGAVEASAAQNGTDGWGATFLVTVSTNSSALTFTLSNGSASEPGAFSVDVSGSVREAWLLSGLSTPITARPPAIPSSTQAAVYYLRPDTIYAGWGLHVWGDQVVGTAWGSPLAQAGISDVLGAGFLVDTPKGQAASNCPVGKLCLIVHKGDTKDPGPDMSFDPTVLGNIVFVSSGSDRITSAPPGPQPVSITGASAHLLKHDVLAWDVVLRGAAHFELRFSPTAEVKVTGGDVVGGEVIPLTLAGALDSGIAAEVPYLSAFNELTLPAGALGTVKRALKGQLVAVARDADGGVVSATKVQTGFALDDVYPYEGPLGPTFDAGVPTLTLWAPTAKTVVLNLFDDAKVAIDSRPLAEGDGGVWAITGTPSWAGKYYQYQVTVYHPATDKVETVDVTDPYSVNLSTNGLYSQVVDLSAQELQPAGWNTFIKPALAAPEDIVIYESHIRDFSALDSTVDADKAGKFLAFEPRTDGGSLTQGQQHLKALAEAGLTHVHLLPAFDIATVDENPANRVDINQPFSILCAKSSSVDPSMCTQFAGKSILEAYQSYEGDSSQQQVIASYLANLDAFNWGYDPFHYGAVEGSYASTAEGTQKIVEFRRMVMGLSSLGLRTVMDVVYNHTNAAGPTSPKSVLDKVVPGYYHRLNPTTGAVETSSCCANTASERRMMERLMIDTLVRWARDYKVDGFRFDLMGLHFRSNIEKAKAALAALSPTNDGVDGSKIYLYGEGWDMGELAGGGHGVNASQTRMGDAGVGTFNDRIRDAVRGGGPFDNGADLRTNQGFSNGLFFDPNERSDAGTDSLTKLLDTTDWIRIGMAANLADFKLENHGGSVVKGSAVVYNGAPTGYAEDPQEVINYVSAHDNQTLWDILAYKLPTGTPAADRVRAYDVALDTVLLGQGIPFFHMGDDVLRSKSMDKNSYDSGDWFNQLDWSGQHNGWKIGLPGAGNDGSNWLVIKPLFADTSAAVSPADIAAASAHFQTMLKVRTSSPLFRLRTKADVMTRVDFTNTGPSQVPGVVAMTITDAACAGADLDPSRDAVVIIINADKVSHTITVTGASGFTLHAALQSSADAVVKTASATGAAFTVPARTTAVFEQLRGGARGTGLPCNTK